MEILAELETNEKCSGGLCKSNDTSQHLPLYMFSNVNDGVPETTCHEGLREIMVQEVDTYLYSFAFALSLTVIVVLFYFLVFLGRIYHYCRQRQLANKRN